MSRVYDDEDIGIFQVISQESPLFRFGPDQLEILQTPDAFFNSIEKGIKTSKRRVVLATLYLGTGDLEKRLVRALADNPNSPAITFLGDGIRSTRPLKVTTEYAGEIKGSDPSSQGSIDANPLFLLQRIAKLPNSTVSLYHSHKLRGFLRRVLPERINEAIGLQHMKVYVFDDDVVISGANLSEEYFRTRQDRGWHFREIHGLANFYSDLVRVVAGLSYRVTTDGRMEPVSQETDPVLTDETRYCDLFRSRLKHFLSNAKTKYTSDLPSTPPPPAPPSTSPSASTSTTSSFLVPLVQMGAYGIHQEAPLVQRLLRALSIPSSSLSSSKVFDVALATGYFNPTDDMESALINIASASNASSVKILCAAPMANSFYKSKGISGWIPAAYREMLISFLGRITHLPNISIHEFSRPGWTFHAKGLWVDTPCGTSVSLIGSSNYGYRSRDRDLESQLIVVTRDVRLRQLITEERRKVLWDGRYIKPVAREDLLQSGHESMRIRWYARWVLPMLRKIM